MALALSAYALPDGKKTTPIWRQTSRFFANKRTPIWKFTFIHGMSREKFLRLAATIMISIRLLHLWVPRSAMKRRICCVPAVAKER